MTSLRDLAFFMLYCKPWESIPSSTRKTPLPGPIVQKRDEMEAELLSAPPLEGADEVAFELLPVWLLMWLLNRPVTSHYQMSLLCCSIFTVEGKRGQQFLLPLRIINKKEDNNSVKCATPARLELQLAIKGEINKTFLRLR